MRLKKNVALMAIIGMTCVTLTACGNSSASSDKATSKAEQTLSTTAAQTSKAVEQTSLAAKEELETETKPENKEDKQEEKQEEKKEEKQEEVQTIAQTPVEAKEEPQSQVSYSYNLPYYIRVNRQACTVTVYNADSDGNYTSPVIAFACSVGKDEENETPLGTYNIIAHYRWCALAGGVTGQYATRITGPYLFHSVPYMDYDAGTLEEGEYNKLGSPASLGCVRMAVSSVKWIYDNCEDGTIVEIYDDSNPGPLGKPGSIYVDPSDPRAGWDPTDPDPSNPWN